MLTQILSSNSNHLSWASKRNNQHFLTRDMRQYKFLISTCLLLMFTAGLFAQRNVDMNNPKIEQLKIGYLTEKMRLTTKEAQDFWPLYNEYNREMRLVKGKTKLKMDEIKLSIGNASEKEMEQLADELIKFRVKQTEIFENYYPKFKSILPIEKVLRFYKAEEEFPRWVLKQVRQNQQKQQNQGGPANRNRPYRNP